MKSNLLLTFFLVAIASTTLHAQALNSPLSIFGIGDMAAQQNGAQLGLAGISTTYMKDGAVNPLNPASYSGLKHASFNLLLGSQYRQYSSQTPLGTYFYTNLSQMTLGFPLGKKGGLSLGLLPYSNVNYQSVYEQTVPGFGQAEVQYNGSGGLREFYAGTGWTVFENGMHSTRIGANVRIVFGSIENGHVILNRNESDLGLSSETTESTSYKGTGFSFSAIHSIAWDGDKHKLNIGASAAPNLSLNGTNEVFAYTFSGGLTSPSLQDTIVYNSTNTSANIPTHLSFGLSYELNSRWLFMVESKAQPWSSSTFNSAAQPLKDYSSYHLGVQFTAEKEEYAKLLQRISYRAGLKRSTGYISPFNSTFSENGMSFGLGVPLRASKSSSSLDISVEAGNRSADVAGAIGEQYVNIWFGFSFSPHKFDRWFVRPKID